MDSSAVGCCCETSDARFLRLLPWLMLAAALTFTFGGQLTARLRRSYRRRCAGAPAGSTCRSGSSFFSWSIAAYGGYFGGGMGIMMLAAFAVAGMTNMHAMNGIKALLAVAINGVALVEFVAGGRDRLDAGTGDGGRRHRRRLWGAALARRVDPSRIRLLAIVIAWIMTVVFLLTDDGARNGRRETSGGESVTVLEGSRR